MERAVLLCLRHSLELPSGAGAPLELPRVLQGLPAPARTKDSEEKRYRYAAATDDTLSREWQATFLNGISCTIHDGLIPMPYVGGTERCVFWLLRTRIKLLDLCREA